MFEVILFYLLILFFSFCIFCVKNPVYSIINFILVVLCYALLLIRFELDYLAFTLILVYVGAIMVLFLFMMMMLNIRMYEVGPLFWSYAPATMYISLFFIVQIVFIYGSFSNANLIYPNYNDSASIPYTDWSLLSEESDLAVAYGEILYDYYFIELFICAFLLLIGMIGSIVLTLNVSSSRKKQIIYNQVETDLVSSIRLSKSRT